jgi:hypothetical protein
MHEFKCNDWRSTERGVIFFYFYQGNKIARCEMKDNKMDGNKSINQ